MRESESTVDILKQVYCKREPGPSTGTTQFEASEMEGDQLLFWKQD